MAIKTGEKVNASDFANISKLIGSTINSTFGTVTDYIVFGLKLICLNILDTSDVPAGLSRENDWTSYSPIILANKIIIDAKYILDTDANIICNELHINNGRINLKGGCIMANTIYLGNTFMSASSKYFIKRQGGILIYDDLSGNGSYII